MQAHSNTTHIAHNGIAYQITCGNCNYLLLVWYLWSLSTHGPLGNNFVTVYNMLFVIFRQKTVFSSRRPAFCYFVSFSSKIEILLSIQTTNDGHKTSQCLMLSQTFGSHEQNMHSSDCHMTPQHGKHVLGNPGNFPTGRPSLNNTRTISRWSRMWTIQRPAAITSDNIANTKVRDTQATNDT